MPNLDSTLSKSRRFYWQHSSMVSHAQSPYCWIGECLYPRSHLLESAVTKASVCVVRVLLEKGVHKRCKWRGVSEKCNHKERQEVVGLFKLHGVTLDGEWTRLGQGTIIWQEKYVNSMVHDRQSLYSDSSGDSDSF